jgi:hypothetical protein
VDEVTRPARHETDTDSLKHVHETDTDSLKHAHETDTDSLKHAQETDTDSLKHVHETDTDSLKHVHETDTDSLKHVHTAAHAHSGMCHSLPDDGANARDVCANTRGRQHVERQQVQEAMRSVCSHQRLCDAHGTRSVRTRLCDDPTREGRRDDVHVQRQGRAHDDMREAKGRGDAVEARRVHADGEQHACGVCWLQHG